MGIHREVAAAPQTQVHDRVPGEEREHVIQERDPGVDGTDAGPIELQSHLDAGFLRFPVDLCASQLHALPIKHGTW
jgi:hypothetical protein